jgi:rRNA pseudouridine-1189 N-methylase Emg1 (Nep1/Mra1 family)
MFCCNVHNVIYFQLYPIALSRTGTLVNPWEWVETLPQDEPAVFIFGAMAHGHITKENTNYVDELFALSEYPVCFLVLTVEKMLTCSMYVCSCYNIVCIDEWSSSYLSSSQCF